MADISQVKLPDGTTYNLKDSYVRTNYRALNNNDFDTINVTELNAGDLIVTGAARFLNTINGSISGNAVTATKATQDESGNNIKATYAASFSISDHTITLKNKNGVSLGTVTVPDNATDNTKLPLAGGTMTGQIVLASNGYKTSSIAGYSADQYGNFKHQSSDTSQTWNIQNNAGTNKFSVYWENGNVTAVGNITAPKFIGAFDEANLAWGGKNFSSGFGCIDAALMDELGANRFQFIKADAITVEYSRDGGSTWTDYGATDAQKQQVFAQGGGLIIGKADSTNKATKHPGLYQLRITIDTGVANVYTVLNKFIIYVTTNGSANCSCKIQKALQSTPTTFVDHTDWIPINGWSGYNVLNTSILTTYGNSASGQYGRVRFIFKDGEDGNTSYNGLLVLQIKAFGGVGWSTPSTMAKTGHIYSYNENQDAIFPNMVQANYLKATTNMTVSSGKITQLTSGHTMLFADGIGISNPTTSNDVGWIRVLGTGESDTVMEIATGDDGGAGEQIVVRQYNTSSSIVNEATLLDKSGNTSFPKNVTATKFIGALQGNADTATTARKVVNDTVRRIDPNTAYYDAGLRYYLVSSSMTTDKPSLGDGKILDMQWDNNGGWASQLFITNSNSNVTTGTRAMLRSQYQTTWKSWIPMAVFNETTPTSGRVVITDGTDGGVKSSDYTIAASVPSNAVFTDTKNTAGSTDTSSKIFLIGATSQAANPQTYSQDTAYVGTDGCLYSGGSKVLTAHQDISGKVSKSGDTMSGALTVEASNSYSSYNEGIRINAGARTYATLLMGGTNGTTSGTNDGAFWIGVYNTGTTARRLMIAHNGSTNTGTYFYASSSSDISPSLRVGSNLQVANVISANVSNSGTAGGISLYSTDPTSYGVAMRSTSNGGKHGYVQGDWGIYNYMAGADNRGWIFVHAGAGNRASISTEGHMVLNGSLTLGGNTTNTSGVRQVYNSTTKSLDFVFVA